MDIYNIFTSKIPASIEEFDPRKKKTVTFLNPHSYTLAFKNVELFQGFDIIAPDGILVVFILNLIKATSFKIKRFSCDMTSIVPYIFDIAIQSDLSVYFLGSDADSVKQSTDVFKSNFPALKIAGCRGGYFADEADRTDAIDLIVRNNPDMILIGMGAILQEGMAMDLRNAGYKGAIYTCGGFLHQTKHEINFYPQFINKINLRFFYRVYKESGFLKRTMKTYPKFCYLIISRLLNNIIKEREDEFKGKPLKMKSSAAA